MSRAYSAISSPERVPLAAVTIPARLPKVHGRARQAVTVATLVAGDMVAIVLSCATVLELDRTLSHRNFQDAAARIVQLLAVTIMAYAVKGLYPGVLFHPAEELRRLFVGSAAIALFLAGLETAAGSGLVHCALGVVCAWLASAGSVCLMRHLLRTRLGAYSWWGVPAVMVGGKALEVIRGRISPWRDLGLKVVASIDDAAPGWGEAAEDLPAVLTCSGEASEAIAACHLTHAILVVPALSSEETAAGLEYCRKHFRHVLLIAQHGGIAGAVAPGASIGALSGLLVRQALLCRSSRFAKRIIDLLFGVVIGVCAIPLMAAICLAIRLTSAGPVFYHQKRIGRHGRFFTLWKFRTMVPNADNLLDLTLLQNAKCREEWAADHKLRSDPRLTWVGRILRKTSLDELPQIWNIIRGDMSFVGPRPIVESECPKYGASIASYQQVRPGVTGLWQVSGRNNTTYSQRVEFDTFYVYNWSIWLDLYILARTVRTVLTGEGAY
jgi:Undecaprenyl-phosphate galactose phosphotransferase WbaP